MTSAGAAYAHPLISELKQILLDAFYGREFSEGTPAAKEVCRCSESREKSEENRNSR